MDSNIPSAAQGHTRTRKRDDVRGGGGGMRGGEGWGGVREEAERPTEKETAGKSWDREEKEKRTDSKQTDSNGGGRGGG